MSTNINTIDSASRVINLGEPIILKKLGDVRVKELSLEGILTLSKELIVIFQSFDKGSLSNENAALDIAQVISDPKSMQALRTIAAATTDKSEDDFSDLGISDWLKWATAFKNVSDWEEIRELFSHLIPSGGFQSLVTSLQQIGSQPQSTDSQLGTGGQRKRS